jgi:high-affinity iron transporter
MFSAGIIVFRETLEAALFVGIIAASTRGLVNRTHSLSIGVALGALGSLLMASMMGHISDWANGIGQEIVDAVILTIALAMLAWHCIWVSNNSQGMVQEAKQIGNATTQGHQTLLALAIVVALSVLREGAETVLFVSGLMAGSTMSTGELISSAVAGVALGICAGWLVYKGLGFIKTSRLFQITNILILLLAGSLASQIAKTANQADWISVFGDQAWDVSHLIPSDSITALVMHGILGFDVSPTQLQVIFYLTAITVIWTAARQMKFHNSHHQGLNNTHKFSMPN